MISICGGKLHLLLRFLLLLLLILQLFVIVDSLMWVLAPPSVVPTLLEVMTIVYGGAAIILPVGIVCRIGSISLLPRRRQA